MKNQPSSKTRRALEFALRSITAKRQTEREMSDKLQKRFPNADHKAILLRLKDLDYINDPAFCKAWIRYRSQSSPRGKYVLQQELKRKGIREEDMEEALLDYDEAPVLLPLAEKQWEKLRREPNLFKRKQKLTRFLASRGFTISAAIAIGDTLAQNAQE